MKRILMTGENSIKVNEGIKTMTRRPIIPQEFSKIWGFGVPNENGFKCTCKGQKWKDAFGIHVDRHSFYNQWEYIFCPFGKVGDLLYMVESYQITVFDPSDEKMEVSGYYGADKQAFHDVPLTDQEWSRLINRKHPMRFTSGRFMYKSLSRVFLKIIDIRAERLHDITIQDILKEGVTDTFPSYKSNFVMLWDSIYKDEYQYKTNPFVWAIEFKKYEK